jgi:Protein of unknown function (DUF1553)/Protein of unknown function (DUF1549)/Planctomycete cytochrome C
MRSVVFAASLLFLADTSTIWAQANDSATLANFFETKVRPVLAENCYSCHGPKKQQAGLRLDSKDAAIKGSDEGPVLVAGQPEKSPLIKAIRHAGEPKMPPKGKMADQLIEDLTTWVKMGAYWPESNATTAKIGGDDSWKKHWAFQPVCTPARPQVKNQADVQSPVDAFIFAKLESQGLSQNPRADRRTLLRRAKYDLLGLPATAEEIAAFEMDTAPDAFAKVVDGYLASPHYGERWARHWLDVARYADTKGYVFNEERRYAYAYGYRDYVIKAFNDDLPYDQFVLQQLAADRLVAKDLAEPSTQAAMGFLTLGRRFLNNANDIIDDRIDVVGRGLLGLTIACARCHDHKFDPIPTKDYYSLHGVFASSVEPKDMPLIAEPEETKEYLAFVAKVKEMEAEVAKYQDVNKKELAAGNRKFRDGLKALQQKMDAFKATSDAAPPRAMILQDKAKPVNAQVFLRGNPNNPGPKVPRQFLSVLAGEKRQPFTDGSGRLEMAQAIVDKNNPLTARVFVNRVWMHLFGQGLVTNPSDFGVRTEPPSHPELLDYLASRFMEEGWSIKKMQRFILLSRTYQTSSAPHPAANKVDPENRLLARMNRKRLDFEAMRDALLAVGGNLDLKMFGRPVDTTKSPFTRRRTIYGFIDRQNLPGLFRTFDLASPDATNPQRYLTTVPQQALFLLNSPFAQEQAKALVRRPEIADETDTATKIQNLYHLAYGRIPDVEEARLGAQFLADGGQPAQPAANSAAMTPLERYAQVLLLANEFMFVD